MFSKEYEFRYGDLDENSNIKASAVLELLQDISVLHSDTCGSTDIIPGNTAWLLEGWHLKFYDKLRKGSVSVNTGIMDMSGFHSHRKYEVYQQGSLAVIGTAVWYVVDMDKRRITRIPKEVSDAFESVGEADNGLPYVNLKPCADAVPMGTRQIERRDLDTNRHLNNVKAVEIALDYLPEEFDISELCVKYRKEILKDQSISVHSVVADDGILFEIYNDKNEPCVLVKAVSK